MDISGSSIRLYLFLAGFLGFLAVELISPYRPASVSKPKRLAVNLSLTGLNALVLQLIFAGAVTRVAMYTENHHIGLLNLVGLPDWARIVITLVFLDFMLYIWHLLNHVVPFFWRFHRVHHTDLNMDVSTASRFHIGELAVSAVIKIGLIYLLGAAPLAVLVFESALVLSAQFQHSSLKIAPAFERIWWVLFVPPSMHRIHHSVKIRERNSNYGTVFSLWDRALGTMVRDVDQSGIIIGLGGHFEEKKLNIHHLMAMPFSRPVK